MFAIARLYHNSRAAGCESLRERRLFAIMAVWKNYLHLGRSHSGLVRGTGNAVGGKTPRGFKSHPPRHDNKRRASVKTWRRLSLFQLLPRNARCASRNMSSLSDSSFTFHVAGTPGIPVHLLRSSSVRAETRKGTRSRI